MVEVERGGERWREHFFSDFTQNVPSFTIIWSGLSIPNTHVTDTCLQNCTMCKHSCCLWTHPCWWHWSADLCKLIRRTLQQARKAALYLLSRFQYSPRQLDLGMSAFLICLFLFVLFQSRSLCTPMQLSLRYKLSFIIRGKTEYIARFSIWHVCLRPPGHKIMFSAQSSQQTPYMYKLNVEPSQFLSHTGGSDPLMFCSIQHFCPHRHYLWLKNRSCQISPANNSSVWRFSAFETADIENTIKGWKVQQVCEEILERPK